MVELFFSVVLVSSYTYKNVSLKGLSHLRKSCPIYINGTLKCYACIADYVDFFSPKFSLILQGNELLNFNQDSGQ